jgi:hypothetical protein
MSVPPVCGFDLNAIGAARKDIAAGARWCVRRLALTMRPTGLLSVMHRQLCQIGQ